MLKIAYFELKKLLRDRRWLALIILQPIILLFILGAATIHDPKNIKIAVFSQWKNEYSNQIIQNLQDEKDLKIEILTSEKLLKDGLDKNHYRGGIVIDIKKNESQINGDLLFISNSTVPEISSQAKLLALNSTKKTLADFAAKNLQAKITTQSQAQSKIIQSDLKSKIDTLETNLSKLSLPNEQLTALTKPLQGIEKINLNGFDNLAKPNQIKINESKNTTRKIRYFDFYASAVVMLLVLITCLNMSSASITQERIDGTFERFFVTPYTKTQMIMGKMLTFSVISLIIAFVTIGTLYYVFNASLGPLWLVILITYLTSLSAVAIGLLVSSFTHTIAESIQVSITIFFSCLILTQFIFQTETMHPILTKITWLVPFTYSMQALREVNLLNVGFMDVWQDIAILGGSVIVFISLAIVLLHRKAD